ERAGVTYSNAVIAVSKNIAEHIRLTFQRQATYIPNGVNIPPRETGRDELKRWGLIPRKYVFTACRLVPEKGLHDLIEAYRAIKDPSFKLVIAGDADHETDYSRKLKNEASGTAGVVLTGYISGKRLQELFSNAGLFVLPSYFEGLPIALLEALSYGLPVLVSDIPQHKEIPLHEFRYFRTGDSYALSKLLPEAYARGISELEQEENWLFLRKNYDWDNIAAQTLQVYASLKPAI
ncbi:MAG: glycosyltransferase family 4 protein, partial [bacterium]